MPIISRRIASSIATLFLIAGCNSNGRTDSFQRILTGSTVINWIQVPADPGEAADATLLGVDANNNGVRDEVERRIAQDYGKNPQHFDGVMRTAKSMQRYIVVNGDPDISTVTTAHANLAGACMYIKFSDNPPVGARAINETFARTVNTLERIRAYQATVMAAKEISSSIPENPCQ